MENINQRRSFLKGAFSLAMLFSLKKTGAQEQVLPEDNLSKSYFFNPAYSVDSTLNGDLIFRTNLPGGKIKELKFTGIEKDLLHLVRQNKPISGFTEDIGRKYQISEGDILPFCGSIIQKLSKEGIIVDMGSNINIIQTVVKDGDTK